KPLRSWASVSRSITQGTAIVLLVPRRGFTQGLVRLLLRIEHFQEDSGIALREGPNAFRIQNLIGLLKERRDGKVAETLPREGGSFLDDRFRLTGEPEINPRIVFRHCHVGPPLVSPFYSFVRQIATQYLFFLGCWVPFLRGSCGSQVRFC